jgi:site-specific DNA-methyltransferase (adenine-specific)
VYGSGFPKSLDVSKAIDKSVGVEREIIGNTGRNPERFIKYKEQDGNPRNPTNESITTPATDAAKQWNGWGTALKPAYEIIVMCRKPLEGTVAQNVQKWGVGGINIDGCRVPVDPSVDDMSRAVVRKVRESETWEKGSGFKNENNHLTGVPEKGRFPANLIHDGSDEVLSVFPDSEGQCGDLRAGIPKQTYNCYGDYGQTNGMLKRNDSGSAARFFYCAKSPKSERNLGLPEGITNTHPTVKPLTLLQYLCRLITPPGGLILDPFSGSGSTGIASNREGFNSILIEIDIDYAKIAEARTKSKH